jgi:hypothetical protein
VVVHAGGDRTQQLERLGQPLVGGRRLDAGQPLEVHGIARVGCARLVEGEQAAAVLGAQHMRRTDAGLLTQGFQPGQLRLDLGSVVIAVPVDAQHGPFPRVRVVDGVRRVLAHVEQGQLGLRGHSALDECPARDRLQSRGDVLGRQVMHAHRQLSRPSSSSSTRVISARATSTSSVDPAM